MTIRESNTDVLIIGAGPAGLMMATWLAKCGVDYRIVDKRNAKIFNGQADGLQCRTLEIFDAMGFAHRAMRESNLMSEICLWNPDENGVIHRSDSLRLMEPGLSRFQQAVLHQGRIERFFIDEMAAQGGRPVERAVLPTKLDIDQSLVEDNDAYPLTVRLRHLTEKEATPSQVGISPNGEAIQDGLFRSNLSADDTNELIKSSELNAKADQEEIVKAKYIIGGDGAHSWTRNQLGYKLEGDSTDYVWGVIDIIPITDFPDIRKGCTIHSKDSGSILVIPREDDQVRLYVQLTTTEKIGDADSARLDKSHITPEGILESAQRIFEPYKITYRILNWWTAYQVGQRVANQYTAYERVFLAGDAVHTHSPKAGQGMNVSMQDTFNLGWKIASVVKGVCDRSILKTYQSERRGIAYQLIDFDRRYASLFSGRPAKDLGDLGGISMEEFKNAFVKNLLFISGLATDYGASALVAKADDSKEQSNSTDAGTSTRSRVTSDQSLAKGIKIGQRIPSSPVVNHANANPIHVQELLPANGTWRVIIFTGDITQPSQRQKVEKVGQALNDSTSFLHRFTPPHSALTSVFEILAIHSSPRRETSIFDFPEVFRRLDPTYGYDYSKILVDELSPFERYDKFYEAFGIAEEGCAVVIRPDQYVAYVGPMEDVDSMNEFFGGFMLEPREVEGNGEVKNGLNGKGMG